jgi:hypothetical protein
MIKADFFIMRVKVASILYPMPKSAVVVVGIVTFYEFA